MKKILISTYHFPPLHVVASNRAEGIADHLHRLGWDVTVLTFGWPGEKLNKEYQVIRLPLKNHLFPKDKVELPWHSPVKTWIQFMGGLFENHLIEEADLMEARLDQLLSEKIFDLLLGIFSPHFHIKQCFEMGEKHGIPYFVDFRDLWNNDLMNPTIQFDLKQRIQHYYIKKYWKKWSENMLGFSSVSLPLVDYLEKLTKKKGICILNGMDEISDSAIEKRKIFSIGYFGNLLPPQDIQPFVHGLALLDKEVQKQIQLLFYAIDDNARKTLETAFEANGIEVSRIYRKKVSREQCMNLMKSCHILYYPPYTGYRGIYSSKIFEYMGSGSPILVTPSDRDVVEDIVSKTSSGKICEDASAVENYISAAFYEWSSGKTKLFDSNREKLHLISRAKQVELLSDRLKSLSILNAPRKGL